MIARLFWFRPLARALRPYLGTPPRDMSILGSPPLGKALSQLGYRVCEDRACALAVAYRPSVDAIVAVAASMGDGGKLIVVDNGFRRSRAAERTYTLARAGFVEVGQVDSGHIRLTMGVRLRI